MNKYVIFSKYNLIVGDSPFPIYLSYNLYCNPAILLEYLYNIPEFVEYLGHGEFDLRSSLKKDEESSDIYFVNYERINDILTEEEIINYPKEPPVGEDVEILDEFYLMPVDETEEDPTDTEEDPTDTPIEPPTEEQEDNTEPETEESSGEESLEEPETPTEPEEQGEEQGEEETPASPSEDEDPITPGEEETPITPSEPTQPEEPIDEPETPIEDEPSEPETPIDESEETPETPIEEETPIVNPGEEETPGEDQGEEENPEQPEEPIDNPEDNPENPPVDPTEPEDPPINPQDPTIEPTTPSNQMRTKKEGLYWINKRTNQFRYSSDENRPINYLQPLETYIAGQSILRGQPVSVALERDLKDGTLDLELYNEDPSKAYVVLTNPSKHETCLGIALEPASPGDVLHIQNIGSFIYDSYKANQTHLEYYPTELTVKDIGKKVYVKTSETNEPQLTTDEYSWKTYKNIICLGTITDVPLQGTTETTVNLSIDLGGDQRGFIDHTQFEVTTGEDFNFKKTNPIRFLAVSKEEAHTLNINIGFIKEYLSLPYAKLKNYFIAFTRYDGKIALIGFDPNRTDLNGYINGIQNYSISDYDINFLKSTQLNWDNIDKENYKVFTVTTCNEGIDLEREKEIIQGGLQEKIIEALNWLQNGESTVIATLEKRVLGNLELLTYDITYDSPNYEIYTYASNEWSLDVKEVAKGVPNNKGKAIVADIRNSNRQEVIGVYYEPNEDKVVTKDTQVLTLRNGLFEIPQVFDENNVDISYKLIPGATYYLGFNGNIITKDKLPTYLSSVVKVGFALTPNQFVVSIDNERKYNVNTLPLGYIKQSVNNNAEYGYILCDGITKYNVEDYPELYSILKNYYSDIQLKTEWVEGE